jgi:hypothetical protein
MIVFLQASIAPAFAKRGGPDLGGGFSVQTFGTYAGVLVPQFDNTDGVDDTSTGANSIGLFSLGVPDTGVAQGAFVVFVGGTSFNGTITGVADPLNGRIRAILDAISTYEIVNPLVPDANLRVFAQGNMDAEIRETANFGSLGNIPTVSTATTRLEGLAQIDIFGEIDAENLPIVTNTVEFVVDGFKQSGVTADTSTFNIGQDAE